VVCLLFAFVHSRVVMLNLFQYLVPTHSRAVMLNLFQYLVFVEQVQILKRVQDDGVVFRVTYSFRAELFVNDGVFISDSVIREK
jgi:hypothetical protein